MSLYKSIFAYSAAYPNPTHKNTGKVPDLILFSYPPPVISGFICTRDFLFIYNAPTPLGPYILCPDILIKSKPIFYTSTGFLIINYAQSL